MKRIIYYSLSLLLFGVFAISCNEEDNDHLVVDVVSAGSVRAIVPAEFSFLNFEDLPNAKYVMDLTAYDFEDGNLIESYDIYGTYTSYVFGETSDRVLLESVTSFPSRVEFTAAELAQAFGVPNGIDGLSGGDTFAFDMEVQMKDGRTFTAANTSDDIVLENNSRGTFFLNTFVGCPSALAGTYTLDLVSSNIPASNFTTPLDATIVALTPGVYTIDDGTMGLFGTPVGLQFAEICGEITVTEPSVNFATLVIYNQLAGTSFDPATGVITFDLVLDDNTCCGAAGIEFKFTATPN